jgi:uncharacterized OsmC-like protein
MDSIRKSIEQASQYLNEHPEKARASDSAATAIREDGLRFRVEGPWDSLTSDMAESVGGGASAPSPGWLLRAALAACDATVVAMEAARDGIELTDLEVSVESESDFRGVLGVDPTVHPGPQSMRVEIRLAATDATDEQLRAIVERAEAQSPVRDALARTMSMTTEIAIGAPTVQPSGSGFDRSEAETAIAEARRRVGPSEPGAVSEFGS